MSLESKYFKANFGYQVKLVNKYIAIIRFSKDEKRQKIYKNLVFKMMKDIVKKNICNYLNLLQSVNNRKQELPTHDELISECYIIFDKCLEKYKISKTFNFYFYFNKSLIRNFFKNYQHALQQNKNVEVTDALITVANQFHEKKELDTTDLLIENLHLTSLENKICKSRLIGQKTSEFLKKNPKVTNDMYTNALKHVKEILNDLKEKGEL